MVAGDCGVIANRNHQPDDSQAPGGRGARTKYSPGRHPETVLEIASGRIEGRTWRAGSAALDWVGDMATCALIESRSCLQARSNFRRLLVGDAQSTNLHAQGTRKGSKPGRRSSVAISDPAHKAHRYSCHSRKPRCARLCLRDRKMRTREAR